MDIENRCLADNEHPMNGCHGTLIVAMAHDAMEVIGR